MSALDIAQAPALNRPGWLNDVLEIDMGDLLAVGVLHDGVHFGSRYH